MMDYKEIISPYASLEGGIVKPFMLYKDELLAGRSHYCHSRGF